MTSHIEFGQGDGGAAPESGHAADDGWTLVNVDDESIRIRFSGHLSTAGGVASAERVRDRLGRSPAELVLEVDAMTGYDRGARVAWQEVLWPARERIEALVVIGGSAVIRMGAAVIAMFLGVPLVKVGQAANEEPARASQAPIEHPIAYGRRKRGRTADADRDTRPEIET